MENLNYKTVYSFMVGDWTGNNGREVWGGFEKKEEVIDLIKRCSYIEMPGLNVFQKGTALAWVACDAILINP